MSINRRSASKGSIGFLIFTLIGGVAFLSACGPESPESREGELSLYGKKDENCKVLEQKCAANGKQCDKYQKRCQPEPPADQCCDVLIDCMNNLWVTQEPQRPDSEVNEKDPDGKDSDGAGTVSDEPYSCKRVWEVCDVSVVIGNTDDTKNDDDGLAGKGGDFGYQQLFSRLCVEEPPPPPPQEDCCSLLSDCLITVVGQCNNSEKECDPDAADVDKEQICGRAVLVCTAQSGATDNTLTKDPQDLYKQLCTWDPRPIDDPNNDQEGGNDGFES